MSDDDSEKEELGETLRAAASEDSQQAVEESEDGGADAANVEDEDDEADRELANSQSEDGTEEGIDENESKMDEGNDGDAADDMNDEEGSDSSDDDSDSSDSDNNDDDDDQADSAKVGEDGLSEYERLRLARIQRNQQYLAQLGLEKVQRPQKQQRQPKKPKPAPVVASRQTLSRRSKRENIDYAKLTPLEVGEKPRKSRGKGGRSGDGDQKDKGAKKEDKQRSQKTRMDIHIHREFVRIRSEKRALSKEAKKAQSRAEKEVKFWTKRWKVVESKLEKIKQHEAEAALAQQELQKFGGLTIRQMIQEIDRKMPEVHGVIHRYEGQLKAEERAWELDRKHEGLTERARMMSALDEYPKALKAASTLLNVVLQERAPKDPPPPRRSKRGAEADEAKSQKPKKQKKSENASPAKAEPEAPAVPTSLPTAEVVDNPLPVAEPGKKSRKVKPKAKVVGGWVSPEFAARLDRQWLSPPPVASTKFRLDQYVPQVGDVVLYYPKGHKELLDAYPDVLGEKTRQSTRVPLWNRANLEEKKKAKEPEATEESKGEAGTSAAESESWWTQEWVDAMKSDDENNEDGPQYYPILCTVQSTSAEFPPDPNTKATKKRNKENDSDTTTVVFKAVSQPKKSRWPPKLRLAVTLKPLTTIRSTSDTTLEKPPTFAVVTFPSPSHKPFLLPFAWAYAQHHAFEAGQQVKAIRKNGPTGEIKTIRYGDCRLDTKGAIVRSLSEHFKLGPARSVLLTAGGSDNALGNLHYKDIMAVLNTFDMFLRQVDDKGSVNTAAVTQTPLPNKEALWEVVKDTLPPWNGVELTNLVSGDEKEVSAWELTPLRSRKESDGVSVDFPYSLDNALRVKLSFTLEELIKENSAAAPFIEMVTDEIAPSYSCAVPVTMCFNRILTRLGSRQQASKKPCFYRSVGALLQDIGSIRDNCLLYNNPESDLVSSAVEMVTTIKDAISRVVRMHNKELSEASKADQERQRLVLLHCTRIGEDDKQQSEGGSNSKTGSEYYRVKTPFKQEIYRDWLQDSGGAGEETGRRHNSWIPQAGDRIKYSKDKHKRFVVSHYPSLETHQCSLPNDPGQEKEEGPKGAELEGETPDSPPEVPDAMDSESNPGLHDAWRGGVVRWTRSCFPKTISQKSKDDAATFVTNSTILAMGVSFDNSAVLETIYWRPCLFSFERSSGSDNSVCDCCGLSVSESFVCFEDLSNSQPPSKGNGDQNQKPIPSAESVPSQPPPQAAEQQLPDSSPQFLSDHEAETLHRCVGILKRKCMLDVDPSALDEQLTKANINSGFVLPQLKVADKTLPTYDQLLKSTEKTGKSSRKKAKKPAPVDPFLISRGFVPPWLQVSKDQKQDSTPRWHETVSPWPRMSLELVSFRLANGFYRHRDAVENDIVESYASTCFLILGEAAGRKKSPLSIKRVAKRAGAKSKNPNADKAKATAQDEENEEEESWVKRVIQIRDLYSSALVAVSNTRTFKKLTGLVTKETPTSRSFERIEDPAKIAAHKKLTHLRDALRRDYGRSLSASQGFRQQKLRVTCNGKTTAVTRQYEKITRVEAQLEDKTMAVKIILDKEEFFLPVLVSDDKGANDGHEEGDGGSALVAKPPVFSRSDDRVCFQESDFNANPNLTPVFFGKPGQKNPCARCQGFRRTLLACRVVRAHSNPDFDFVSFFNDAGSIDKLLQTLDPTVMLPQNGPGQAALDIAVSSSTGTGTVPTKDSGEAKDVGGSHTPKVEDAAGAKPGTNSTKPGANGSGDVSMSDAAEKGDQSKTDVENQSGVDHCTARGSNSNADGSEDPTTSKSAESGEAKSPSKESQQPQREDVEKSQQPEPEEQLSKVDPVEMLEKAKSLLSEASSIVAETEKYAETKDIMSKEFVTQSIPIDEEDGHYIYCVVCGLSGNLLCCDGCANVLHVECARDLKELPEGAYYCEECEISGKAKLKGDMNTDSADNGETKQMAEKNAAASSANTTAESKGEDKANEKMDTDNGEEVDSSGKSDTEGKAGPATAVSSEPVASLTSSATKSNCPTLPFGRSEFDANKVYALTEKVQALQKQNPERLRLAKRYDKPQDTTNFSDPIEALSKKIRRFLGTVGIETAKDLFSCVSSEVGEAFQEWRKSEGMAPLKRHGETASVSAWKRFCKETASQMGIEVEKTEDPQGDGGDQEKEEDSQDEDNAEPQKKRTSSAKGRPVSEIEDALESLSPMALEFLESIKIQTAEAFIEMRTSDIANLFAKWRKRNRLPELRGSGNVATISAWKTTCRGAIEAIGRENKKKGSTTAKRRTKGSASVGPLINEERKASEAAAAARLKRAQKRSQGEAAPSSSNKKAKISQSSAKSNIPPNIKDALDVLSGPARDFLQWCNIGTAEEFIELQTTSVAEQLATWRGEQGLPKLKGSGNGATISAWKTLCRKAVEQLKRQKESEAKRPTTRTRRSRATSQDESPEGWSPPRKKRVKVAEVSPRRINKVSEVEEATKIEGSRSSARIRSRRGG